MILLIITLACQAILLVLNFMKDAEIQAYKELTALLMQRIREADNEE